MSVIYDSLIKATVKMTNGATEAYQISANVQIANGNVAEQMDNGVVKDSQGNLVATFNKWSSGGLQSNIIPSDREERSAIFDAIDGFVAEVEQKVIENPITL